MFGNVNFDQFSLFANPAVKSLWSLKNVSAKDIQIYELTVIVQRLELYNSALKSYSELDLLFWRFWDFWKRLLRPRESYLLVLLQPNKLVSNMCWPFSQNGKNEVSSFLFLGNELCKHNNFIMFYTGNKMNVYKHVYLNE